MRAASARAAMRCDHFKKVTQRREEQQDCWLDRKIALANRASKRKVEEECRRKERKEKELNEYRWGIPSCGAEKRSHC